MTRQPYADVAALPHEHGYADQAHLNREFKRFANRAGARLAAEMLALLSDDSIGIMYGAASDHRQNRTEL